MHRLLILAAAFATPALGHSGPHRLDFDLARIDPADAARDTADTARYRVDLSDERAFEEDEPEGIRFKWKLNKVRVRIPI
jgi:hypothetical protein